MEVADTTIVMLTPESGDTIQTLKAGILEIADIFAVNKADREGADRMVAELKAMLEIGESRDGWKVPVLALQAIHGVGLPELMAMIEDHRGWLRAGRHRKPDETIRRDEVLEIIWDELKKRLHFSVDPGDNPYLKAERILKEISWNKQSARSRRKTKRVRS